MSLELNIVTPSRKVLSVSCEDVVLPGYDGEMGILSEHAQFINRLGAGMVRVEGAKEETKPLAISGGVVEISEDRITVLADEAVFKHEVDRTKLEKEQELLSKELVGLSEDAADRETLFEKQRWLTAQADLIQLA